MGTLIGVVVGILIVAVLSSVVIWIVGKLGWGIEVDSFLAAFLAAIVIAILAAVVDWLWRLVGYTTPSGIGGVIIHLLTAAIFLQTAGSLVPGLRVKGFKSALIGAASIAVVSWIAAIILTAIFRT